MAKHKVDNYKSKKVEHQNRLDAQAHRRKITAIVGGVVLLVLTVWMGYAVWDNQANYEPTAKNSEPTEINFDAMDSYLNELYSE
ncbi:MAG: hypothetical protein RR364_00505 [Lachnospiraceae bacterium]